MLYTRINLYPAVMRTVDASASLCSLRPIAALTAPGATFVFGFRADPLTQNPPGYHPNRRRPSRDQPHCRGFQHLRLLVPFSTNIRPRWPGELTVFTVRHTQSYFVVLQLCFHCTVILCIASSPVLSPPPISRLDSSLDFAACQPHTLSVAG